MAVRTGQDFLEGLRDGRDLWLEGEKVTDVTTHPKLTGAAHGMAGWYDYVLEHADECIIEDPVDGGPMNAAHMLPRSAADLDVRHRALERMARYHVGMMGRSPDYVNVSFAGFAALAHLWALDGNEAGAANLVEFQREVARRDLSLTHVIVHPTIDKSVPDTEAGGGEVALHKVADTENGIIVRGARVLATLAPFADEITVYPGQPIPKGADAYALAFSVPMNTPGLKFICRDSYSSSMPAVDRPFSSRFDEQDAFVVFDDVEVPSHRVFLDGSSHVYNMVMARGWVANIMQQTSIRAMVKFQFAYEMLNRMVTVLNGANPTTNQLLGEVWTYHQLVKSAVRAAEADSRDWGEGAWLCDDAPFVALRPTVPGWMVRTNEIIRQLGSHNLLAVASSGEMADPELRPYIDRYLTGAGDHDATERMRVFRTAWDFAGTGLAGRTELYERFYLASAPRMYQVAHFTAQRDHEWKLFDEFQEQIAPF